MSKSTLKNLISEKFQKIIQKTTSVSDDQIVSCPKELANLAESLEFIIKDSESKFLELGGKLQTLYSDAEQLAQLTVNVAKSIGDKSENGLLTRVATLSRQSLKELRKCQTEIADNLKQVDASAEYLENLCDICPVIEKTGIFLNAVGLNIAIESSRSSEGEEMFTFFVQEVRQLAKNMLEISQNIYKDSESTRGSQLFAHDRISEGLHELEKLNITADETVRQTVLDIRQTTDLSLKSLEKSGIHSKEISRQAGEVVVAIQFHDITRQQIEHIVLALRDTEHLIRKKNRENVGNKSDIWESAYTILSLQVSQLEQVIREIEMAREKCIRAFEHIENHVRNLVTDISMLNNTEDFGESKIEVCITALTSGLQELHKLLVQGYDLKNQIGETASQVSETIANLSRHVSQVRGISMELHLKALNAIVKSSRLQEEGITFEVLAQEVNNLSRQSGEFVKEVVKILESIVSLSEGLKTHSSNELQTRHRDQESTGLSFDIGIRDISHIYEEFRRDASVALQDSESLRCAISDARHELGFLRILSEQLRQHLFQLEKIRDYLKPQVQGNHRKSAAEIKQIAHRYTMKRERDLHGQYIGMPDNHLKAAPPSPPDTAMQPQRENEEPSSDDDLGDNVELF